MKSGALLSCFSFCLVFISVSAFRDLNNINDLKEHTTFGKKYPQHGLMLLYWLANNVEIDENDVIQLQFDPSEGNYGHHYYNGISDENTQRRALPDLPRNRDRVYYTLGDLSFRNIYSSFPDYVTQDYHLPEHMPEGNIDRIAIDVEKWGQENIAYNVYIAQHYENQNQGRGYDPDKTFRVTPSLLNEIQNVILTEMNIQGIDRDDVGLDSFRYKAGYRGPPSFQDTQPNRFDNHETMSCESNPNHEEFEEHNDEPVKEPMDAEDYSDVTAHTEHSDDEIKPEREVKTKKKLMSRITDFVIQQLKRTDSDSYKKFLEIKVCMEKVVALFR